MAEAKITSYLMFWTAKVCSWTVPNMVANASMYISVSTKLSPADILPVLQIDWQCVASTCIHRNRRQDNCSVRRMPAAGTGEKTYQNIYKMTESLCKSYAEEE